MEHARPNPFIVADSSGLVSFFARSDRNHHAARASLSTLTHTPRTIIVPVDVFTETINTLNKIGSYELARAACAYLTATPPFLVIEDAAHWRGTALTRFQAHGSGALSLTDWIVLSVADTYETKLLFAFDEKMRKQGYRLLPAEEVTPA